MSSQLDDGLALKNRVGMRVGSNVRLQGIRPELLLALMIVQDMCNSMGSIFVVTAILNGPHMRNSLHYTGAAVDFVTSLDGGRAEFVEELRGRLGLLYDVIDEVDHIHIEYQPHEGAVT